MITLWTFMCLITLGDLSGTRVLDQFKVTLPTREACEEVRKGMDALRLTPPSLGLPLQRECIMVQREDGEKTWSQH